MAQSNLVEQAASLLGGGIPNGLSVLAERLATELVALLRSHGVAELERAAGDVMSLIDASRTEAATIAAKSA